MVVVLDTNKFSLHLFQSKVIDTVFPLEAGAEGLVPALQSVCQQAATAVSEGYRLIVLSDRCVGPNNVPIPYVVFLTYPSHT